ncbi:Protein DETOXIFICATION 16 [Sarracenia purpurea var. burkii]
MEGGKRKEGLETALIPKEIEDGRKKRVVERKEILGEVKKQLRLAGPIVSVNLLVYCLQVISVMFVGHLGELPLSGAAMATAFASVTGFSFLMGMASALDTFCGQSYGAKQHHMLGIHMQRAMLVLLLACIPVACIWANAARILLFFGQDPEISAAAGSYARFMILTIFPYAVLQCHVRFLQAQSNVLPMMASAGLTTLLHLLVCWVLVSKSGLGYRGAALSTAISYWINALLLAVYVRVSPSCSMTWTGFSTEALHDVPKFLRLAIPSALMICVENWSFELMILLSGLLPNPKLETSVLSITLVFFSLYFVDLRCVYSS